MQDEAECALQMLFVHPSHRTGSSSHEWLDVALKDTLLQVQHDPAELIDLTILQVVGLIGSDLGLSIQPCPIVMLEWRQSGDAPGW